MDGVAERVLELDTIAALDDVIRDAEQGWRIVVAALAHEP